MRGAQKGGVVVKKYFFLFILILLLPTYIFSQSRNSIVIEYEHSRRIPYNKINIELYFTNNEYKINVKTEQMAGKEGYEYSNTEQIITIDKDYFDKIYNSLLCINYGEIIANCKGMSGLDGIQIKVIIGDFQNNIIFNIWSPEYDSEKRKTIILNSILKDIFQKIGLAGYL